MKLIKDHNSCSLGYGYEARGDYEDGTIQVTREMSITSADNIGRILNHRVTSPRITVWTYTGKTSQYAVMIILKNQLLC
jgi:hypothetical protein